MKLSFLAENPNPKPPSALPHDRTLRRIVDDLKILSGETEQLQTQWDPQRAQSIVRVLRSSATLLDMLTQQ